jgi:hypothetical protein
MLAFCLYIIVIIYEWAQALVVYLFGLVFGDASKSK